MSRDAGFTRLSVRVRPSTRRTLIKSYDGQTLGIDLSAPATDNRANEELIRTLADALHIAKSRIQIVRGHTSRAKLVELDLSPAALDNWLEAFRARDIEGSRPESPGALEARSSPRSE